MISGINHDQIISQLLAIESRPRDQVNKQITILKSQKTAYFDISARLLALQTASGNLGKTDLFNTKKVTSSNSDVLTGTASKTAAVGTYTFTVDRLVSSQQLLTKGFGDADTTAVGAATFGFESAAARLDGDSKLTDLNGGSGVARGKIRITDRAGASADIDLTRAVHLSDVLDAINNAAGINVTASISADGLKITDNTGSTSANLTVVNLGSYQTATQLGIAQSVASATLTGSQINKITGDTRLATLNDGLGVRILGTSIDDFSITDDSGAYNVSLSGATTLSQVISKINAATSSAVTASIGSDGASLKLTGAGNITVAALNSSKAAADLGLAGAGTGGELAGARVLAKIGSKLLKNLHGSGSALTAGSITVNGSSIDLSSARSVSDVISGINAAGVPNVTASLNTAGNGVKITRSDGGALTIADTTGNLADYLNIDTTSANGKIDSGDLDLKYIAESTLLSGLNGGKGVAAGKFKITDSSGASSTVDLTQGEKTIKEVIDEINSRPIGVKASINATGDGLLLTDTAGGASKLKIEESGSTTAKDLGILGEAAVAGGNFDGSLEKNVSIAADDSLQDVADKINAAGLNVSAAIINDGSGATPFRLNIVSTRSGVAGRLVFDDGGADLAATELVKGQDAVAFYGSSDPTQALLVTSSTNSLANTISGVTVNLLGTSNSPVQLTVSRDDSAVVTSAGVMVTAFNGLIDTLNKYDKFDSETKERGLLLGDATVAAIRTRAYSLLSTTLSGIGGQFKTLAQVGFSIGDKAKLSLDESKLTNAIALDQAAVQELFTSSTTVAATSTLPSGVTVGSPTTKKNIGFGPRFEEIIKSLTDNTTGTLTRKTSSIDSLVQLNTKRVTQLNELLANRKTRLEAQFSAMETALSQLQSQQSALASLSASIAK